MSIEVLEKICGAEKMLQISKELGGSKIYIPAKKYNSQAALIMIRSGKSREVILRDTGISRREYYVLCNKCKIGG